MKDLLLIIIEKLNSRASRLIRKVASFRSTRRV